MGNLDDAFAELARINEGDWIVSEPREKKRGRKVEFRMPKQHALGAAASPPVTSSRERMRKMRSIKAQERCENIAILDMETDPFDDATELKVAPFLAVLYSDQFETVVIWEEDLEKFVDGVISAIKKLPGRFTIYAHNGGRFDYLFLVSRLRGAVSFKGRGIMSATVGAHELRDSFHIIPERLANWQKDKFDYSKLRKNEREKNRAEIIKYCVNDCRYLLDIVKKFIEEFGLKLTIAGAAKAEFKKAGYEVGKFNEGDDAYMRQFFFGGRVECLRGRGDFKGHYKLYDVNSLYPFVMATRSHPIGAFNTYSIRYGEPGPDTVFLDLECRNNGALIGRGPDGETSARIPSGRFRTSIWEYEVARKYELISDVQIHFCIDCSVRSDFSRFVLPLYENRLTTKSELDRMKKAGLESSAAYLDMKKDDIFYKLLLNNGYGFWAINPRRFVENYLTDPDVTPPPEWFNSLKVIPDAEQARFHLPAFEGDRYWIWQKPNPGFRFNNVGVAASITGAARAVLFEALQHATDPIYCDTDSIICRDLRGVTISKTALGAWDLEDEFSRVIVNGKKLYSTWHLTEKKRTADQLAEKVDPRYTVKSKGVSRVTWNDMERLFAGETIPFPNRAPTLDRYGNQEYLKRKIRATAPILETV